MIARQPHHTGGKTNTEDRGREVQRQPIKEVIPHVEHLGIEKKVQKGTKGKKRHVDQRESKNFTDDVPRCNLRIPLGVNAQRHRGIQTKPPAIVAHENHREKQLQYVEQVSTFERNGRG